MTKLEEMITYLSDEQNKGSNELFFVTVRINDAERDEMIINHVSQLDIKIAYYDETYNSELIHKYANVEIVDYGFIPYPSRLSRELNQLI